MMVKGMGYGGIFGFVIGGGVGVVGIDIVDFFGLYMCVQYGVGDGVFCFDG